MNIIQVLSDAYFWIMALSINMIFQFIKPFIKIYIIPGLNFILPNKMQIDTSHERATLYKVFLFFLSLIAFWLMNRYDTVKLIENSLIVSALWLAFMSELIYDVGYKTLYSLIKKRFTKEIGDV